MKLANSFAQDLTYFLLRLQLIYSVCNGVSDCACEAQGGLHHRGVMGCT